MAYTVTVKDCNSQSGISNATIGNGNCYSVSNGVYTFETCEDVAACAGGSSVGVSVDNASLPSSGGQATFTVTYYGKSSSFSATKSKTGTGGSAWTGNVSIPAHVCPTASTINLSASNNSTTSQVVYTVSAGGSSATVTQAAYVPPTPTGCDFIMPSYVHVEGAAAADIYTIEVTAYYGSQFTRYYDGGCTSYEGGGNISRSGNEVIENAPAINIGISIHKGRAETQECESSNVTAFIYINDEEYEYPGDTFTHVLTCDDTTQLSPIIIDFRQ